MSSVPPSTVLDALRATLPAAAVAVDRDVLAGHRRDRAGTVGAGWPLALVRPTSTGQVQQLMSLATRLRVPVVPWGAGSGLSGGANAVDGGITLSLERMNAIKAIAEQDLHAVVEPGVLNGELTRAVAERGLAYPPDPASAAFSSIGGNVATNAGGLCCVKYGVTRDYILALEVVLADGSLVRTGRRTIKGVAGYDLTALFVGSEGTLGIITEVTCRLRPAAAAPSTLVAFFPSVAQAGAAAIAIVRECPAPSMLELMDRITVAAVDDWKNMGLDRSADGLLVAQSDALGSRGAEEVAALSRCCEAAGASFVAFSSDPAEAEQLTEARRLAYPALERLGDTLLDDVAVPRSQLPAFLDQVRKIATRTTLTVATFGHAGDGNMHPTVVYNHADAAEQREARFVFSRIVEAAIALGGTITGEHGVGSLKREFLGAEIGEVGLRVHSAIKDALDPLGILNPGKVLP